MSNTADPQLYWTERWGAFNYTLPYLENGLYEVSIDMAESYWEKPKDRNFYIQVQVSTLPPAPATTSHLRVTPLGASRSVHRPGSGLARGCRAIPGR